MSKVQEMLADPQKLEELKSIANSFMNEYLPNDSELKVSSEQSSTDNPDNIDITGIADILNLFLAPGNTDNDQQNGISSSSIGDIMSNLPIDIIIKIQKAMSLMNQDDHSIHLLKSLRSLMSDSKKDKVDNAIKLLRIARLLPLVKEFKIL